MDNKVTKKRIVEHLEYDWYIYLIVVIATIVAFSMAFSQINATRNYEDVDFFVSCYPSTGINYFADNVFEDMNNSRIYTDEHKRKYGDNVLREINIEESDPESKDYGTLLPTHGYVSSDVLIIGEKHLGGAHYVQLTDELLTDYLLPDGVGIDDLEYYTIEDKNGVEHKYGIKLSNFTNLPFEFDWHKDYNEKYKEEENEENLPDSTFYLVINTQSVSIGKFGKFSKDKNAQALYCVNRFISYYK